MLQFNDTIHDITIIHPITAHQLYEVYDNARFANAFMTLAQAEQFRNQLLQTR